LIAIATGSRSRSSAARLILASALVVALSLAFTGAASAQTPFQATVSATQTLPAGPCSNGAFFCGTANLAGYGGASWNFYVTSTTPVPSSCGSSYTATTEFTLAGDPGSTLVLDESGPLCAPGNDGAAFFKEGAKAYGHPFTIVGSWSVDPTSTGQFAGLSGSGTDLVKTAGAHAAGSYSGALG
jgi:hypothetical protein